LGSTESARISGDLNQGGLAAEGRDTTFCQSLNAARKSIGEIARMAHHYDDALSRTLCLYFLAFFQDASSASAYPFD
jgi:hypothetical protein